MVLSEHRTCITFEEFAMAVGSKSVAERIQKYMKTNLENGLQVY